MNPLQIVAGALSLIASIIADARARNDADAVAALEALVADSAIGRGIVEGMVRAQVAIDHARAQLVEGVPMLGFIATPDPDDVLDVARVVSAPLP